MKLLTLRERQIYMLNVLKDIDKFCRENNISYTLCGGTMLGAVRHKGFIPWDDDLDIDMLRQDYDKFIANYKSDKYKLLCNTDENPEMLSVGYAKVVDPSTFTINKNKEREYGVFVDVFPLEGLPEDPSQHYKYYHKGARIHNRFYHRHRKDFVSIIKSYGHSLNYWRKKLNEIQTCRKYMDSEYVSNLIGSNGTYMKLPRAAFKDLIDIPFEGCNFLSIRDTDSYLKALYGPNYMVPVKYPMHQSEVYAVEKDNE